MDMVPEGGMEIQFISQNFFHSWNKWYSFRSIKNKIFFQFRYLTNKIHLLNVGMDLETHFRIELKFKRRPPLKVFKIVDFKKHAVFNVNDVTRIERKKELY